MFQRFGCGGGGGGVHGVGRRTGVGGSWEMGMLSMFADIFGGGREDGR